MSAGPGADKGRPGTGSGGVYLFISQDTQRLQPETHRPARPRLVRTGRERKRHGPGSDFDLPGLKEISQVSSFAAAGEPTRPLAPPPREGQNPGGAFEAGGQHLGRPEAEISGRDQSSKPFLSMPSSWAGRGRSAPPLLVTPAGQGRRRSRQLLGKGGEQGRNSATPFTLQAPDLLQDTTKPAPRWC